MKTRRLSWKIATGIVAGAATIIAIMCVAYLYPEIIGPVHEHARNTFSLAGFVILLLGAGGVLLFITEKRKSELKTEKKHLKQIVESAKVLRESEERFRDVVYSMADWVWEVDENGVYTYCSERVEGILGYSRDEIIGKTPFDLMPKDESERVGEIFTSIVSEKKPIVDLENWNLTKEGLQVCLLTNGVPILDYKGELLGYRGVDKDITEAKRAEEEKEKLELQLQRARKMEAIGTLAGGIAHDFNNLLSAILGNASIMLFDVDATNPHYENLKNIEKQVKRGATLTRQLLGYARKGRYEVKPIDLNQLVEEISETFGRTRKGITIHRDLAENLFAIGADEAQIEQVLLNMYVNAGDAMPGRGDLILKTMNVTHKDMKDEQYDAKPGNYVLLKVTDTGSGMDKETMARIFDPFFTTKEMGRGTGLGLASAYGIIKGHGGYIDVESEKGRGTTFSIYLPASEKKTRKTVETAKQIIEGSGILLLVDDEAMILDVGVKMLNGLGYTVLEAKGGIEAVEIYKENKDKIDLVILDMVMPGMGGGEAYDRMKEINSEVKVLLSSGYSLDSEAKEILTRGCDGFIQKPFGMKELSQSIREVTGKE